MDGRTHARTDARTENIYSIFRDKLLLRGEHGLPQTVLTLNLLRQSNVAPTVSAYQYVNGPFDYNKMPLAPMGCAVQVHENSKRRGTWAGNSTDGWHLRPSPEHYRCHVIYCKNT